MADGRRAGDHGGTAALEYATRADVREMSRDIIAQVDKRFDEQRDLSNDRHAENIDRIDSIGDKVAAIDTRVTILEQLGKTFGREFENSARRLRELRDDATALVTALRNDMNAAISAVKGRVTGHGNGEARAITQRELGILVALAVGCVGGTAAVMIWVLKVVGKL